MLDFELDLPHDRELRVEQQVVDVVDPARCRVLDRENGEVGLPLLDCIDDVFELGAPQVEYARALSREIFQCGEMAVRAFDALERDTDDAGTFVGFFLVVLLLNPDRIVDNVLEDAGDVVRVQPQLLAELNAVRQKLLFAVFCRETNRALLPWPSRLRYYVCDARPTG